jgi:hypothetical protein
VSQPAINNFGGGGVDGDTSVDPSGPRSRRQTIGREPSLTQHKGSQLPQQPLSELATREPGQNRPATNLLDPCNLCGRTDAHPDSVSGLCGQCETDMAADRVEMERDDARCCTHYPTCGGRMR